MAAGQNQKVIDRFWALVDRSGGPDACWPWTGQLKQTARPSCRYGVMCIGPRRLKVKAHRIALSLAIGRELGRHETARHVVCENPRCCNPAHLTPGSQVANIADAVRSRRYFSERVCAGMSPSLSLRLGRIVRLAALRVCRRRISMARALELVDSATVALFPKSLALAIGGAS